MSPIESARDAALVLLERLRERGMYTPLASGLSNLDETLGGGIRPGLTLLGGMPGVGKTAFGLQLMMRAAAASPAVYFSAEQSADDLLARLLASEIGRPISALLDAEPNAIIDAFEAIERLPFERVYVVADHRSDNSSISSLRSAVDAVADRHQEVPFIAVDYLQRLRCATSDQASDLRVTVSRNSEALTDLVREQGLTSLVISSLNRASYRTEPSLDAFKESGNVEFDADLAMLLRRREDGNETTDAASRALVELWIVKNRIGRLPPGPLVFVFDGRLGSFRSPKEPQ